MKKNSSPTPTPARRHPAVTWLIGGACWFSCLCILFLLTKINVIFTEGADPLRILLLYPLAMCASAAGMVRRSRLSRATRYILHPLLTIGGTYLFGLLPFQIRNQSTPPMVLAMIVLLLILYGIGVGIGSLILHKKNTKANERKTYESQFNKH